MTDGTFERSAEDYEHFVKFSFQMLRKGTCAKIMCPDHRHYDGPSIGNDRCWTCMKQRQEIE